MVDYRRQVLGEIVLSVSQKFENPLSLDGRGSGVRVN
jgi:hypothetical protein